MVIFMLAFFSDLAKLDEWIKVINVYFYILLLFYVTYFGSCAFKSLGLMKTWHI